MERSLPAAGPAGAVALGELPLWVSAAPSFSSSYSTVAETEGNTTLLSTVINSLPI